MRKILLLLGVVTIVFNHSLNAQTPFEQIGKNRIIQKYHTAERLKKIQDADPLRLQALWDYFTQSFTFSSDLEGMTIDRLLNEFHFNVYSIEHLRSADKEVIYEHRGVLITLKTTGEITSLLHGYSVNSLVREIPYRSFPTWTSTTFSEDDFNQYKQLVWDWAKDFPEAYLTLTSDPSIRHIRFQEISAMTSEKQVQLLLNGPYIIID